MGESHEDIPLGSRRPRSRWPPFPLAAASIGGFSPQRLSQQSTRLSAPTRSRAALRQRAPRPRRSTISPISSRRRPPARRRLVNGKRKWTQDGAAAASRTSPAIPQSRAQTPARPTLNLTQGEQIAVRAPPNGQSQIHIANAPLVFVGYGVTAPERNWDDFKGQDVRGKILVVLVNDPDFEGGEGDFGGKAMTYYGRWTYKYEEARAPRRRGRDDRPRDRSRLLRLGTVKNSNTNTSSTSSARTRPPSHTPFESWIQRDARGAAVRRSGLNFEQAKAAAKRKDFRPVDAQGDAHRHANAKVEHDHLAQRGRHPARQEISRRDGDLHRPLGPSRHRPARRQRRLASTMARSTTAPASPS